MSNAVKPDHKAILAYYESLKGFSSHKVKHETAVSTAFLNLLTEIGKMNKWLLIPNQTLKAGKDGIRPDGTMRDKYLLPRGHWEAKDTDDVLDVEIRKKIARGYPTENIIFEDTREGRACSTRTARRPIGPT